jgi:4-oxalocrotonate tautomerase
MPFIQVPLGEGRSPEQKVELVKAVSKAAADAVGVSETTVRVWLVEVPADVIMVGGQTMAERRAAAATPPPSVP